MTQRGQVGQAGHEPEPEVVQEPEVEAPRSDAGLLIDGLLFTPMESGGLAVLETKADGGTAMVILSRAQLVALRTLLDGRSPTPPALPDGAAARGPAPAAAEEVRQHPSLVVSWRDFDDELKSAHLLEQYEAGVALEELAPGWETVLPRLVVRLRERAERIRMYLEGTPSLGNGTAPVIGGPADEVD